MMVATVMWWLQWWFVNNSYGAGSGHNDGGVDLREYHPLG